jgi:hypothetical protein
MFDRSQAFNAIRLKHGLKLAIAANLIELQPILAGASVVTAYWHTVNPVSLPRREQRAFACYNGQTSFAPACDVWWRISTTPIAAISSRRPGCELGKLLYGAYSKMHW